MATSVHSLKSRQEFETPKKITPPSLKDSKDSKIGSQNSFLGVLESWWLKGILHDVFS
jgi:hypothetical protein